MFHFITDGEVAVYVTDPDGARRELMRRFRGQVGTAPCSLSALLCVSGTRYRCERYQCASRSTRCCLYVSVSSV